MAALQNHRGQPLIKRGETTRRTWGGTRGRGEGHAGALPWREGGELVRPWWLRGLFEVADEPSKLEDTLVGSSVYMRWEKYGWQLGRITDIVTDATPRVFKKFNYRIT
jgi:hypothetical protein